MSLILPIVTTTLAREKHGTTVATRAAVTMDPYTIRSSPAAKPGDIGVALPTASHGNSSRPRQISETVSVGRTVLICARPGLACTVLGTKGKQSHPVLASNLSGARRAAHLHITKLTDAATYDY